MSDVDAMTKTAEERAREIAARIRENADDPEYDPVFDVLTELRQTERAVWLSAAEVVEEQAGYYQEDVFPPDGTSTDAISAKALRVCLPLLAAALRRRAEEV